MRHSVISLPTSQFPAFTLFRRPTAPSIPSLRHSLTSSAAAGGAAGATVRRENPLADPRWDERLARCAGVSFFHSAAWARVLRETYGFEPVYFTAGDPDRPDALLPVMEVNSRLTGRRGIALPFTDECQPLGGAPETRRALVDCARDYARVRGWRYLEVRGGHDWFDGAPVSTAFWGHRLDLEPDETAIFGRVESSARRAIRKAGQSGLTMEISREPAAVHDFFGLLCLTRRRHGVPPQPYRFFRNIQRHVLRQDRGMIVLARRLGRPVAGAVFFHHSSTAIFKFGASDERFQHLRGNNLVMWEAIKWHAARRFTALDFGRTSLDNEGLRRFKLGWGTVERRIEYVRYDVRADRFVAVPDRATGWHNRVFRALPLPLSRLVGSLLYRHMA